MRAIQFITELFDPKTAFPLKWDKQFAGQGEFHAFAQDAEGREIGISFTPVGEGDATEVVFTRGGTHEMTGKGDAARVMATVINAIKIFVEKYKPPYLVFSAKSTGGRASAYTAMIRRVAQGYKLLSPEEYPKELDSYFEFMGSDQPFVLARELTEDTLQEYDTESESSKQIIAKLNQLGYKMLGSGVDATVWAKDEGTVIKILMPSYDYDLSDSAFLAFYGFCQQHKESPYLPKFIDIGGVHHSVFELDGKEYRQIAMEKLAPIQNGSFMEKMVWALSDLATVPFIKWPDVKKQLMSSDFWKDFPNEGDHLSDITQGLSNPQVEKEYLELFITMQQLWQFGRKQGLGWDLHTENVMQRNNIPVITDPYSN